LRQRAAIIGALGNLSKATSASDAEVLLLIDTAALAGLGIGYIDVHLLASASLTAGASLWTRDRRLAAVAARLGIAARI